MQPKIKIVFFSYEFLDLIIEFSPNCRQVKFGRKKIGSKEAQYLSLALFDRCKKLIKNKVTSEIGQTTVIIAL